MGCCGGRGASKLSQNRTVRVASNKAGVRMPAIPNTPSAMVMLEYIGKSEGRKSSYGDVTGIRYVYGAGKRYIYVDVQDAPGLVAKLDNHQLMFKLYVAPKVEVPVVQLAEPEPEPVVAAVKRTRKAKVAAVEAA